MNYSHDNYRGLIPHPATISKLCILVGVKGTWEAEERCPRTSPLTLTGKTRPPPNKGKEKVQEIEEEDRDVKENEQAIVVSSVKEREERERNMSPIWNLSLNAREYHQELVGSCRQQSNNADIMDMLVRMEQGMREKDNQLKLQLELRDEYPDV